MVKNNINANGNKNNIWLVVGVALVVGLVASLITAGITGNALSVRGAYNSWNVQQVYNTTEVDAKFATNNGTLTMLNKCISLETGDEGIRQAVRKCNI